jgi:hypothetical protein
MPDEIKGLQTLSNAISETWANEKFVQARKNAITEVKEFLSSENISKGWKITRNVAGGIFMVGTLLTSPICPIIFPATATMWIGWITLAAGVLSGRAQLDRSKK